MSTRLYFLDSVPDWSRGEGDANLQGATANWAARQMSPNRGASVSSVSGATITGPVTGLEPTTGTSTLEWVSDPLDRDITISGSITTNLWGFESAMADNVGLGCIVERLDSKGAVISTVMNNPEIGTELPTGSAAARNEATTPTSTSFLKGDRIRVRPYANDAVGTTMAANAVGWQIRINGPTAAADGDSYIEFTEDFWFLAEPIAQEVASSTLAMWGDGGTQEKVAQSFVHRGGILTGVGLALNKTSSPTDNFILEICTDSSGEPSSTVLSSGSIAMTSIGASQAWHTFDITDVDLTVGTKYWIVCRRSGSRDTANYPLLGGGVGTLYPDGDRVIMNSGVWAAPSNELAFRLYHVGSTLYFTNTSSAVDPNGASYDAKEAWTSRGGGSFGGNTNTAAGPTAPIHMTIGGNFQEWFTKQLQAFTLSGLVAAHIDASEAASTTNACVRCEIAVCDSDGTNPVIWAAANDGAELPQSSALFSTFLIGGDDVAIADGKRLRIRLYIDDAPGLAMAASSTCSVRVGGTIADGTGDTYLILPQAVSEFSSGGANVTPTTVSVTTTINASTTSGAASHTTTTVSGTTTVSSPTSSAGASVTPTTVAATTTISTPVVTVAGDANVTPTTVQSVVSNPAPAVVGNANAPPSTVAALAAIDTPTVQIHAPITTTSVAVAASVPTPVAAGSASITTTTVVGSTSVPTPTVTTSGDAAVTPTTVAAATSVPAPTMRVDQVFTLSDVSAAASVLTPTVSAGGAEANIAFLDPPTGVAVAVLANGTLRVTWNSVTGATKYSVERNGTVVQSDVAATQWDDVGRPSGTYTYRVKGYA